MFYATDAVSLGDVRVSDGGYLEAFASTARTGVQQYLGIEMGRPDLGTVNVYRDEADVFSHASLHSFAKIPVTVDHPPTGVSATNWKQVAVGTTGEEVLRDGERLKIGLKIMDQAAIQAVQGGKRELSVGYRTEIVWGDGVAPDGTPYQAKQTQIVADHIAIVTAGRAGVQCRIGDSWTASDAHDPDAARDAKGIAKLKAAIALHAKHMNGTAPTTGAAGEASQQKMMDLMIEALKALGDGGSSSNSMGGMDAALTADISRHHSFTRETLMKTHMIGDNAVEMSDAAIVAVKGLQTEMGRLTADNLKLTADIATINSTWQTKLDAQGVELADAKKAGETKDGEIAALKKQLEDAKLTPQKLDEAVAARGKVIADAKRIAGDKLVTDGKTEAEIRREAVSVHLGDAAKALSDEAVNGAFLSYASKAPTADHLGRTISASVPSPGQIVGDSSAAAYDEMCRSYDAAWKRPTQGNA